MLKLFSLSFALLSLLLTHLCPVLPLNSPTRTKEDDYNEKDQEITFHEPLHLGMSKAWISSLPGNLSQRTESVQQPAKLLFIYTTIIIQKFCVEQSFVILSAM